MQISKLQLPSTCDFANLPDPQATVIPAKAGIQGSALKVDPGVRRDDIQG